MIQFGSRLQFILCWFSGHNNTKCRFFQLALDKREIGFQRHDRWALERVQTGSEMAIICALISTYTGEWVGREASTNNTRRKRWPPHGDLIYSNDSLNLGRHWRSHEFTP